MSAAKKIVITMDGTCGSGKSTIAKRLADRLGFVYLDTGAMYRALTWKALRDKIDLHDRPSLTSLAQTAEIILRRGEGGSRVFIDGVEVTKEIRTPEVTNAVKYLADLPSVRAEMVNQARRIARLGSVLAEGRDTGTVIFPEADYKFYIDADPEVRTDRRYREFLQKGVQISREEVKKDLIARDHADKSRQVGGLKVAPGGIVIDTGKTEEIEENLKKVLSQIRKEDIQTDS
jgi:cytidylate kinase